jgi:hypothetical protein
MLNVVFYLAPSRLPLKVFVEISRIWSRSWLTLAKLRNVCMTRKKANFLYAD